MVQLSRHSSISESGSFAKGMANPVGQKLPFCLSLVARAIAPDHQRHTGCSTNIKLFARTRESGLDKDGFQVHFGRGTQPRVFRVHPVPSRG